MIVILKNNVEIINPTNEVLGIAKKYLMIPNPEYVERKQRGYATYGLDPYIYLYTFSQFPEKKLIIPRGAYDSLFSKVCMNAEVIGQRVLNPAAIGPVYKDIVLRDYQREALENIGRKSGVLVAPAGSGKTIMGLSYVSAMGQKTLWLCHTKHLADQAIESAKKVIPYVGKIGKIYEGEVDFKDCNLTIGLFQALQNKPELLRELSQEIGTVVIDECHHAPADTFAGVLEQLKPKYMLGVSATPDRKDKLETVMFAYIGPILHTIHREDLYTGGVLIKPKVEFIFTKFMYTNASVKNEHESVDAGGDRFNFNALLDALTKDEQRANLVADTIVKKYKENPNGFFLVLSDRIDYCEKMKVLVDKKLGTHKLSCYLHSGVSKKDSELIMAAFRQKRFPILFATKLAKEGLDFPHLTHGFKITPVKGDSYQRKDGAGLEQEIGRIQRSDPNNLGKKAYWYDFVDIEVGVLKAQYYSRRKVYERLGLSMNKKEAEKIDFSKLFGGG